MNNTAPPAGPFTLLREKGPFQLFQNTDTTAQFPALLDLKLVCNISGAGIIARDVPGSWTIDDPTLKSRNIFQVRGHSQTEVSGLSSTLYTQKGSLNLLLKQPHILLLDTREWGSGIELDARRFLACSGNLSAETGILPDSGSNGAPDAVILTLIGKGVVCLLSDWPIAELSYETFHGSTLTVYDSAPLAWSRELRVAAGKIQNRSARTYTAKRFMTGKVLLHPSTLQ